MKVRYVGRQSHQQLPFLTRLYRQAGQGTESETEVRDLRAELLKAEAAHFAKKKGITPEDNVAESAFAAKRQLEGAGGGDTEEEDSEAKRRRILEETRPIDADSEASESDSSEEER